MLSRPLIARSLNWLLPAAIVLLVLCSVGTSIGAEYVSPNFIVDAATQELAEKVAKSAEYHREQLAILWLGEPMRPWTNRCPIKVSAAPNKGAGGRTKFKFDRGEVYGWNMYVQGSVERILDSVIPHEVNHTILACHFRRPLPRWADEGAASLVEHSSERQKQQDLADRLVVQGKRIPLRVLFDMTEYPTGDDAVLALYAQGYSLTQYLVQKNGRAAFLRFLTDAPHRGWDSALRSFYDIKNIDVLEREWTSWVLAGSPNLSSPSGQVVAKQPVTAGPGSIVRSQTPDSRQELIRQAKTALESARLAETDGQLEAPAPRGTAASALPVPPQPSAPQRRTVRPASRDEIQPLELKRIDEPTERPKARVSSSMTSNVPTNNVAQRSSSSAPQASPLPLSVLPGSVLPVSPLLQDSSNGSSERPRTYSSVRETELRVPAVAPRQTSERSRGWAQFPARAR